MLFSFLTRILPAGLFLFSPLTSLCTILSYLDSNSSNPHRLIYCIAHLTPLMTRIQSIHQILQVAHSLLIYRPEIVSLQIQRTTLNSLGQFVFLFINFFLYNRQSLHLYLLHRLITLFERILTLSHPYCLRNLSNRLNPTGVVQVRKIIAV